MIRNPVTEALVAVGLAALLGVSILQATAGEPIQVIDGDTVRIGQERLRFIDIDTPELRSASCRTEQAEAIKAKDRLEALLAAGDIVIERSGDRDRYGRTLGRIKVDGIDVGDTLLQEGLALRWRPGKAAWEERKHHWCPNSW